MIWVFYHGPGCVPHTSISPACRRGTHLFSSRWKHFGHLESCVSQRVQRCPTYHDCYELSGFYLIFTGTNHGSHSGILHEKNSASGLEKNCSLDVVRGGYSENKSTIAGGLRRTVSNPKSLSCRFVKFQNWNESQRRREGLREHHRPFKMSSTAYRWLAEARLQRCRCTTIFANTRSISPPPLVIESSFSSSSRWYRRYIRRCHFLCVLRHNFHGRSIGKCQC